MTLQEAIKDKDRPLSMTPEQWMHYVQADEKEDEILIQGQVKRIVASQQNDEAPIDPSSDEKLDIGIEQMILGCRISMKSLQELQRINLTPDQRKVYIQIKRLIDNAIAPYLADILQARKGLYK